MRRLIARVALVTMGGLSMTLSAFQQAASAPRVVDVEKLKDNLFILKGGGGNTAVFVTSAGAVVVDTKIPGWGQPLLAKIKELTDTFSKDRSAMRKDILGEGKGAFDGEKQKDFQTKSSKLADETLGKIADVLDYAQK